MNKVIITAAVTGSVHVPTMSDHLPITPQQIADEAVRSAEAGAACVHIHARNPENGMPSPSPDLFREIITSIKERSDVIVGITTGGGYGMTVEQRAAVVPEFKPEMASFNMGSMNFGLFPILDRYKEFKFDWEPKYLEASRGSIFQNTFADLEGFCKIMRENDTKPELEMYDIGHIYNAAFLLQKGFVDEPLHMQFVMGILGGIAATVENMIHMKRVADSVFGEGKYTWSVIGAGYPQEFQLGAVACTLGGHVRVGMEDNLRITRRERCKSNAELVERMVRIAREMDREPASPDETREMLKLKGKDKVNY